MKKLTYRLTGYAFTLLCLHLISGCSKSPFTDFCDLHSSNDEYSKCLHNVQYRHTLPDKFAKKHASIYSRRINNYPDNLLGLAITDDTQKHAIYVTTVKDIPVSESNNKKTTTTHPQLIGNIYMIKSAFESVSQEKGNKPSISVETNVERSHYFVNGSVLSSAQLSYINSTCKIGRNICQGSIYIRIIPDDFGRLRPHMIGSDMKIISSERIYEAYLNWSLKWLNRLSEKNT